MLWQSTTDDQSAVFATAFNFGKYILSISVSKTVYGYCFKNIGDQNAGIIVD